MGIIMGWKNEMIVDILSDYDSMMDISGFQMGY